MARTWQLTVQPYALLREAMFAQTSEIVLREIMADTVLALVNTPHNPTGSVMARRDVEHLAGALKERGVPLIVDEVYHPLYFGDPQASAAGLDNVIVIGDMSKALSLAGLRVGWIIDANSERRKRIIDARSYFTISSSPIAEAIATHALLNRDMLLTRLRNVASANLAQLRAVIEDEADLLAWAEPAGGTTAFPWFKDGRDSRRFCETLAENGLLVVPGDCFDRPEHIRIGFGAQEKAFDQAAEILRNVLRAA